ncbi:cysteine desulfurase family protein [Galbitalea sp. SE-J8]|uniref:cysteine desulfurase family protein n=1 Tax=Galbitalea sp. SE-J8 TaxID=3054952 RepID=UPI00259CE546|nr:cysteine desulfurase family protein [Galbitalea sp. SE-J8]MDM4763804.1 cysteine desulfurase family protein [Galbitalea sp. SE-J8]
MGPVYLDHAATSPMPREVIDVYAAALATVGNPSSIHAQGQGARAVLEDARERVAASLGADAVEVVLTGGGTEAVNTAIKGLYWAQTGGGRRSPAPGPDADAPGAGVAATPARRSPLRRAAPGSRDAGGPPTAPPRARIVVPRGEHHATLDAVEWLERHEGAGVTWIDLDERGRIDVAAFERALGPDVALATAIWANNEVGTIQPVAELAALAAAHGVPLHLDAIAAYGYLPIDAHALGVAALSVSAHKIGGPVGIGALYLARTAAVVPLVHGGEQQRARSGTQDAAGAAAFAAAADRATAALPERTARLRALRDRLIDGIRSSVPQAVLRGDPVDRLPGNVHVTVPGCEGDSLLFLLDVAGFSVSTGSACRAGVLEASHVLLAMGVPETDARGALRVTIGDETAADEIDALVAALPAAVERATAAGLADREPALGR